MVNFIFSSVPIIQWMRTGIESFIIWFSFYLFLPYEIFLILLYLEMPSKACQRPLDESPLEEGELVTVNAIGGLALRDAPGGKTLTYIADGTVISRLEKAKNKVDLLCAITPAQTPFISFFE